MFFFSVGRFQLNMEAFLTGRVGKLGVDEEAFVPYIASLASDPDSDEPLRERLKTALENIGAENYDAFLDEVIGFCEGLNLKETNDRAAQEAAAREQAEKALLATKVLRGQADASKITAANSDETPEDRKKRLVTKRTRNVALLAFTCLQELLARYDVPDEIVMDASGQVRVRDVVEKTSISVDGNDNAERVRQAELEQV